MKATKDRIDELELRVKQLEDTLLESIEKDNEIHLNLHEIINLLLEKIDLLQQRIDLIK